MPQPTVSEIVDELERTGRWGHTAWLSPQRVIQMRALARERGLYVRYDGWTDRPEEWFAAGRPGVDDQTGLLDWAALEAELERLEQTSPVSIVVFDVTNLTQIGSSLGKDIADELIRALGRAFQRIIRETREFVARQQPGGDEFVLVLPGVGKDDARVRAESIAGNLADLELPPELAELYRGVHYDVETRRGGGAPRSWLSEQLSRPND